MNLLTRITASEAKENFYKIIESAAKGLQGYEIKLKGKDPVLLITKAEFESWVETCDILSNKDEASSIRRARKEKESVVINIAHRQGVYK